MPGTLIETLARFAADSDFTALPDEVVAESKRLLLDSIGCALVGATVPKGRIGVRYGKVVGGPQGRSTILGDPGRTSAVGAAFANAELINAFDFDSILPPGHVSPYVIPGALAVAEESHASGRAVINAVAVSHEMSYRIGRAMDYLRDTKDGKAAPPQVTGYSSTIFGATAAITMIKRSPRAVYENALGIAGAIAPVNALRSWSMHAPSTTTKYMLGGALAQSAMTAAHLAEFGHRGDTRILDDAEFGYPRFVGTSRWEPAPIAEGLGETWLFPPAISYKPYPVARGLHGLLDALLAVLTQNQIAPAEIESISAWGEGFLVQPVWQNRTITHVQDAQFSVPHALALAAHGIPVGTQWQSPDVVFDPRILDLMSRVRFEAHPDYARAIGADSASRPTRIEVAARGSSYVIERNFTKGRASADPSTAYTTDELVEKFAGNARNRLSEAGIAFAIETILDLESLGDVSMLLDALREHLLPLPDEIDDSVLASSAVRDTESDPSTVGA